MKAALCRWLERWRVWCFTCHAHYLRRICNHHCATCGDTGWNPRAISVEYGCYDRVCYDCGGQSAALVRP